MKRGSLFSFSPLILIAILGILAISCAAAYNGFDFGYDRITFAELAENPWVNAALVFLLVFSVCLFVLRDVFQRSYGAAVVIALVIGIIGSIGLIAAYGPIITKVGPWVLVLFLAIIAISLWRFFRGSNLIWILFVLALLWLLWAKNKLCGAGMLLPEEACIVLNFLAIAIIIIAALMLLWRIVGGLRETRAAIPTAPIEKPILRIGVRGNGTTRPAPKDYRCRRNSRRSVAARPGPGAVLDHWELDGVNRGNPHTYTVKMDTSHTLIAIFSGAGVRMPAISRAAINERRLRNDYRNLMRNNDRIFRRAGNRIPARGTRLGEQRHRNIQKMKQIEELARRHGIKLS